MNDYDNKVSANAAMAWLVMGVLLICVEFCRPGWVIFGVAGGVMAAVGGFHLAQRGAAWGLLGMVIFWAVLAISAFGVWPRWAGWLASLVLPLLCWRMEAHPALPLPVIAATWWLLGIAGRALQNKSGLE